MSKLDELIAELCPDGVEYRELGKLCKIETGKLNANKAKDEGEFVFFTCGLTDKRIDFFEWDTEALLISGNGYLGYTKHHIGKFNAYQRTYVLTSFDENLVLVRFLYHVLKNGFEQWANKHQKKASVPYIVLNTVASYSIPLPPLPVQQAVVEILDKFTTELEAGLKAELEARKKQYEFYRSSLMKINGVEHRTLGACCNIEDNKRKPVKAGKRQAGDIPYYGANNIQDYVSGFTHEGEYLLIAEDGSRSLENYSIQYVNGKFWANNHVHVINGKEELDNRFLFHYLQTVNFIPFLKGGTRAKLNQNAMLKIPIPIPPLEEQKRIAGLLDKFDALTADIAQGLPAEITARRKQYEYYRNKLLTFKEIA